MVKCLGPFWCAWHGIAAVGNLEASLLMAALRFDGWVARHLRQGDWHRGLQRCHDVRGW